MKKRHVFWAAAFSLSLASTLSAAGTVRFNPGAQLSNGNIKEAVAAFEKETGINVDMGKVGGCGGTVNGIKSGKLDVGMMCCPPNRSELDRAGFVPSNAARDAIEFIVHKDNPVSGLTTAQLRDIYQGRIKNWKEVGGNDAPIKTYAHIMCPNREEVMRQFLTGERDSKQGVISIDNRNFAPWVANIKDEMDVSPTVASDPHAIAPVSRSMVRSTVKVLALDGVMPTVESIADESYPLVRYLHLVTKDYPTGDTARFISFLRSDQGQALLTKDGRIVSYR